MTQRFILDENIVILAQTGMDDHENPNAVCHDLVIGIIDICHSIIADDELWERYRRQLYSPANQRQNIGPDIMIALMDAMTREDKVERLPHDAPPFEGEASIPAGSQDDMFLVRLAVETGAILVTTDEALRDGLGHSGIQQSHNLSVLSPDDALSQLYP